MELINGSKFTFTHSEKSRIKPILGDTPVCPLESPGTLRTPWSRGPPSSEYNIHAKFGFHTCSVYRKQLYTVYNQYLISLFGTYSNLEELPTNNICLELKLLSKNTQIFGSLNHCSRMRRNIN